VAYGSNDLNTYNTKTDQHILGGVSVAGDWQNFRAFYGSNAHSGAPQASVNFTVDQPSLVIALGLASSQQQIDFEGVQNLQVDASHVGGTAGPAMIIAHADLQPGQYALAEHTAAFTAGADDPDTMADLIAVFVFGRKPGAASPSP
jgi:hypothetical protein